MPDEGLAEHPYPRKRRDEERSPLRSDETGHAKYKLMRPTVACTLAPAFTGTNDTRRLLGSIAVASDSL